MQNSNKSALPLPYCVCKCKIWNSSEYTSVRVIQVKSTKMSYIRTFFTFGLSRIMFHSEIALDKFLFISFLTNYARLCLSEILTCPKLAYKTSIHLDFTQCQWYLLSTKSNSEILPNSFAVVAVCL